MTVRRDKGVQQSRSTHDFDRPRRHARSFKDEVTKGLTRNVQAVPLDGSVKNRHVTPAQKAAAPNSTDKPGSVKLEKTRSLWKIQHLQEIEEEVPVAPAASAAKVVPTGDVHQSKGRSSSSSGRPLLDSAPSNNLDHSYHRFSSHGASSFPPPTAPPNAQRLPTGTVFL